MYLSNLYLRYERPRLALLLEKPKLNQNLILVAINSVGSLTQKSNKPYSMYNRLVQQIYDFPLLSFSLHRKWTLYSIRI